MPRGGFQTQQAWSQAACDAEELAGSMERPVAAVLETAARGFVAERGLRASPVWWAEDFARYYDAGCKGAPRKAGEMAPIGDFDGQGTSDEEIDRMFGLVNA